MGRWLLFRCGFDLWLRFPQVTERSEAACEDVTEGWSIVTTTQCVHTLLNPSLLSLTQIASNYLDYSLTLH
jgi:hypothetical protein